MKLSAFPANFPRRRHQSCFHSKTAKAYFSCQGQTEMSNSRSNIVFFFKLFTKIVIWRGITTIYAMLSKMFLKRSSFAINIDPVAICDITYHCSISPPRNLGAWPATDDVAPMEQFRYIWISVFYVQCEPVSRLSVFEIIVQATFNYSEAENGDHCKCGTRLLQLAKSHTKLLDAKTLYGD